MSFKIKQKFVPPALPDTIVWPEHSSHVKYVMILNAYDKGGKQNPLS